MTWNVWRYAPALGIWQIVDKGDENAAQSSADTLRAESKRAGVTDAVFVAMPDGQRPNLIPEATGDPVSVKAAPDLHDWHFEFVSWCEKCKDQRAEEEAERHRQYEADLVRHVRDLVLDIRGGHVEIRGAVKSLDELVAMHDIELVEGTAAADLRVYLDTAARALRAAELIAIRRQSYLAATAKG